MSYRHIFKGSAIYGVTQVLTILFGLVKNKCVALLIGAYGMGVTTLLASVLAPLQQLFAGGVNVAAVSHISSAETHEETIHRITALRRGMYVVAVVAALLLLVFAHPLALLTFGDSDVIVSDSAYDMMGVPATVWWMVIISPAVAFLIMIACELCVLQCLRVVRRIAQCTALPALLGVVISVPIYKLWGIDGIAPAMTVVAMLSWLFTRWHSNKAFGALIAESGDTLAAVSRQTWGETWRVCRKIMSFGILTMLSSLLAAIVVYVINLIINRTGGTANVGFWQTATLITSQLSVVMTYAMSTDFFPHLSQVVDDKYRTLRLINQQGQIMMLISAPLVAMVIVAAPLIVRLLLSPEFDVIVPMIQIMSVTLFMRSFFFPLDYICMAKSDKRFYFWMEVVYANLKTAILSIGGYMVMGLMGLAMGTVLSSALDMVVSSIAVRRIYGIGYGREMYSLTIVIGILLAVSLAATMLLESLAVGIIITLAIIILSVCRLYVKIHNS